MPESWRSDFAKMKNRWLLIATVVISLLFHVGVGILFWKTNALNTTISSDKPIYVDMVSAPPGQQADRMPKGRIVDRKLSANELRPKKTDIISYKDNRAEKETHLKDTPFNEDSRNVGRKGKGGRSGIGVGSKTGGRTGKAEMPDSQNEKGYLSGAKKTSTDLISSVSYKNFTSSGNSGSQRGSGNLSPYNPKIGSPGDAVNINTKSFKYMSYFSGIKEKIEWAWVYPQEAQQRGQMGVLTLTFTILRDGSLKTVKLVRSSGFQSLDQAAIRAVRDAADFGPMPSSWDDEELTILANFEYRLIGSKYVF